jgi:hypothetical protein
MTVAARQFALLAVACVWLSQPPVAVAEMAPPAGARIAQRLNPAPVPGGLPGVAPLPVPVPAPQSPPSLPVPAPSLQVTPPPLSPAPKAPDAGGPDDCDCYAEVEVPVYEMGRIVRWQRQPRLVGRHPQCCRK